MNGNSKAEQFSGCVMDRARVALNVAISSTSDDNTRAVLKANKEYLCRLISDECVEAYEMLRFYDIFEWKRERVRR